MSDNIIALFQHIHHLKSLSITPTLSHDNLEKVETLLMRSPASQLERLSLNGRIEPENWTLNTTALQNIRSLRLMHIRVDWSQSHPLYNITTLTLRGMCTVEGRPTWKQLVGFLLQMPLLETLGLSIFPTTPLVEDVACARLPRLKQLRCFEVDSLACATFLSLISFPSLESLTIRDIEDDPSLEDYLDFLRTISKVTRSLYSKTRYMELEYGFKWFSMNCYESISDSNDDDDDGNLCWRKGRKIELVLPFDPTTYGEKAPILAQIYDMTDFSNITCLNILYNVEPEEFDVFSIGLPNLLTIRVAGRSALNLIGILANSPIHSSDLPMPFQKLQKVYLRDVDLLHGCDANSTRTAGDDLKTCMRKRKDGGLQIRKLYIQQCKGESVEKMRELLQFVGSMFWDKQLKRLNCECLCTVRM